MAPTIVATPLHTAHQRMPHLMPLQRTLHRTPLQRTPPRMPHQRTPHRMVAVNHTRSNL
jgi:hypothetical protein